MIPLVLAAGLAHAESTVAIAVGAQPKWLPHCAQKERWTEPGCTTSPLQFVDDDVWRAQQVLSATLGADRVGVLVRPDGSTDARLPTLGEQCDGIDTPMVGGDCLAQVAARLEAVHDPDVVHLFISSHGSNAGVHLEDRIWNIGELVDVLRAAMPGVELGVVVADACNSGKWTDRGDAQELQDPRLQRAELGEVEIMVDSVTPEKEGIQGGAFTRLVLSALAGAADLNNDGEVVVGELRVFLRSYQGSLNGSMAPSLAVEGQNALKRIDAFTPTEEGGARLVLPAPPRDEGRWRWLLSMEVAGRETPFYDVTTSDWEMELAIPAGRWNVRRVLYEAERTLFETDRKVATLSSPVHVSPGDIIVLEDDPQRWQVETVYDPDSKGDEASDFSRVLFADPAGVPVYKKGFWASFFGDNKIWLTAGGAASSPALGRSPPTVGGMVSLQFGERDGYGMLVADLRYQREPGSVEPVALAESTAMVGYDRRIAGGQRFRLGLQASVGASLLTLGGPNVETLSSAAPALDLAPTLTWQQQSWVVRAVVPAYTPRIPVVADPTGGTQGEPDPLRFSGILTVGRNL